MIGSGHKHPKKWMQHLSIKRGALREALHVPAGENIPASKLEAASHSSSPLMRKRANLAKTFAKARH